MFEKRLVIYCVTYFTYKKCVHLLGCRINVPNIVFKHFWSFNKGKMRYLKEYSDTALSRRPSPLCVKSILSLVSQNTLTKTSVLHFPTTSEAVTDTFMLDTNHRTNPPSFSRPYTSTNSRYTTICKSIDGVAFRVTVKSMVYWMCLKIV